METAPHPKTGRVRTHVRRGAKFGAVGIGNTLLDFLIYNVLSSKTGLNLVQSNIISTTVAMFFSFFANKQVVFNKHDGSVTRQAVSFFAVTAFGLYVLQTGTIHLLTQVWLWPVNTGVAMLHALGLNGHDDFFIKNGVKAAATVVSMSWNYVMYHKVVFR